MIIPFCFNSVLTITLQFDHVHLWHFFLQTSINKLAPQMRRVNKQVQLCVTRLMRTHFKPVSWKLENKWVIYKWGSSEVFINVALFIFLWLYACVRANEGAHSAPLAVKTCRASSSARCKRLLGACDSTACWILWSKFSLYGRVNGVGVGAISPRLLRKMP